MRSRSLSFRIAEAIAAALERRARLAGVSRNALAERYLSEGTRMDEHPGIAFRDGALGRRATLAGTRLDVWQVIATLRAHGNSIEETADYLAIAPARVRAALAYYAEFQAEVDAIAAREGESAERAEARWRAEQALLLT